MKMLSPSRLFEAGFHTIAALALASAGCDERQAVVASPMSGDELFALTAAWPAFFQSTNPKVDILFMVDNSPSMSPLQQRLVAGFSQFMTALQNLPGGVPDFHLGVVTSDLGAGPTSVTSQCRPGGDNGRFQTLPRNPATCQNGQLNPGQNFLIGSNDPGTSNFTGDLTDAFGCLALVGDQGCGFEHQLASVRRALDPAQAPVENAGFLRPEAFLAVVLVTNEDDCSAPADTMLFDPGSQTVSDPLGPLASFRCNEYGHLCLVDGTYQHPARDKDATYQGCISDEAGKLDRVGDFVTFLKNLKGDPARAFLAAVAGPPTPYAVILEPLTTSSGLMEDGPNVAHSCTAADGAYADPSVRIAQAVRAFGGQGLLASICDDQMGPVLNQISKDFSRPMAAPCVATPDPSGSGCTVVDRWIDAGGAKQAARLSSCAETGGASPCWELQVDNAACGGGTRRLRVNRGMDDVPATLMTAIDCTAPHA
jgi:hypothetical protein